VVYGSTNRGGLQAVREIIRDVTRCRHLAITPDGPRGPRRVVQPGAVYLAAKTGMLLAPLGVGLCEPWRAKSWDKFAIPKPMSRARIVSGEVFAIPSQVRTADLENHAAVVQRELDRLTRIAEHWATTDDLDSARRRAETLTVPA